MEAYRHAHPAHGRTSHLTKLYSDTKKSALTSLNVYSLATEPFPTLHRKYKIEKDRLIAWGLAWSDDEKGADGDIDDAVAKAGLTETVDSVLRNIKEVTEEADRIRSSGLGLGLGVDGKGGLQKPAVFDQARYEDLLKDLTTSIDTLYDLSRSRRALARGEHPSFASTSTEKSSVEKITPIRRSLFRTPSFASSVTTLVNPPSFTRPALSPYAGLPPRIDASALRLPEEGPPPYESIGVPSTTRLVGYLVRSKASQTVQNALGSSATEVPVLIEFANFDSVYRDTHVPPPLQRLEAISSYLQPMRPESQSNLSLLGYFEDASQPRIGLVYDVPYSLQNRLRGNAESVAQILAPVSLLKLVQKASKTHAASGDVIVPALEYRFRIALRLTEQLHDLHARDLAHGNINSNSVIFTTTTSFGETPLRHKHLRSPLLASFDMFSKCNVENTKRAFNLNIYRHPLDHPASDRPLASDIKYDLYGLALVLIEVGLWTSISELYKAKYSLADFKLRLEKLWIPKLAAKMGTMYMRVVETCLRLSDWDDLSGMTTEALYDDVLEKLQKCCALDDEDADVLAQNVELSEFDKALSYGSRRIRRKPTPLQRQMSAATEPARTRSMSIVTPAAPYRLGSMPNLAAATVASAYAGVVLEQPLSRQPSLRSQVSHPTSTVTKSSTRPSFKEYKRKIVLIQQQWRTRRERMQQVELFREETAARKTVEAKTRVRRQEFPALELPKSLLDEWHNEKACQLAKLVERALKGSLESSSIAFTAYGETEQTARPTFLVCCKSTAKVKNCLARYFKYDKSMCELRVKKDEIRRCHKSRRYDNDRRGRRSMAPFSVGSDKAVNSDYQERPLCGASIGAYRDEEHLPPVSFGGIVVVDGTAYGMSVHHMLEPDDYEEEDASAAGAEDDDDDTSSVGSADSMSIHSHSDDESTVRPHSAIFEDDEDEDGEEGHSGDVPGIMPDDFEEIAITQPALDDAIDHDLHVDEGDDDTEDNDIDDDSGIDSDHLLSYKLGQIHASSGLRRTLHPSSLHSGFQSLSQSLPQEIDWALFELVPPRIHPYNIVKGGTKFCTVGRPCGDVYPTSIRDATELPCAKVHCLGRTSGLAQGVISSTMELVKIHGRSTFSASWTVDGAFGVGGDSGAWVVSNDDGRVCGHVLASRRGRTYICPMGLLLEDIKTTLGARSVTLPTQLTSEPKRTRVTVEQAVKELCIAESEAGGVALPSLGMPAAGVRRSMKCAFTRAGAPIETAG